MITEIDEIADITLRIVFSLNDIWLSLLDSFILKISALYHYFIKAINPRQRIIKTAVKMYEKTPLQNLLNGEYERFSQKMSEGSGALSNIQLSLFF